MSSAESVIYDAMYTHNYYVGDIIEYNGKICKITYVSYKYVIATLDGKEFKIYINR